MTRKTAALLTAFAAVAAAAAPAAAATATIPFSGCEATDVHALAKDSQTEWTGPERMLGEWRFRTEVALVCGATRCVAEATDGARHPAWETESAARPAFALPDAGGRTALSSVVEGAAARALAADLGAGAFEREGLIRRVWVDYATLADRVAFRARTEIACEPGGDRCTIETDPLAFVTYGPHEACGSFGAATKTH
jgi:hypothetical protein